MGTPAFVQEARQMGYEPLQRCFEIRGPDMMQAV